MKKLIRLMMILSLNSVMMTSCGKEVLETKTDPRLTSFIELYKKHSNRNYTITRYFNIENITVKASEEGATVIGTCVKSSKGNIITIHKDYFEPRYKTYVGTKEIFVVFLHEIGHCELYLKHDDSEKGLNVMNSMSTPSNVDYKIERFFKELNKDFDIIKFNEDFNNLIDTINK